MTGLIAITLCCLANSVTGPVAGVRHRIASQLLDGLSQWWQMPALLLGGLAVVAFVIWTYRRDAVDCPRPVRVGLALLRLGAFAALAVAALDFERTSEREIVQPSRVAVLVDASASMTLTDDREPTRLIQALDLLESSGLLEELRARHEVALWRFDAAAERIAVVPQQSGAGEPPMLDESTRDRLVARGIETRIGDAVNRVLADEPAATLAGIFTVAYSARFVIDVFFGTEFGGGKHGKGNPAPRKSFRDGSTKGGGYTKQFRPHRGRQGYFFYPTVRDEGDTIERLYGEAVQRVLRKVSG